MSSPSLAITGAPVTPAAGRVAYGGRRGRGRREVGAARAGGGEELRGALAAPGLIFGPDSDLPRAPGRSPHPATLPRARAPVVASCSNARSVGVCGCSVTRGPLFDSSPSSVMERAPSSPAASRCRSR
jgi:hypothetical protein